ncbi:hypothetical protein [Staphylococcus capitis]|uniref:hypothetical protein n=1 Tax=Staphylococcus capitis TaxID=29388 RepID=UPI0018890100|nr:hypothetical protein [Staphylococcus capitis]MBF2261381.1 hypothetical protein [Staphylococcus capitis]MBF2281718.1 hypothetical protein [Staphylococcus capitis]
MNDPMQDFNLRDVIGILIMGLVSFFKLPLLSVVLLALLMIIVTSFINERLCSKNNINRREEDEKDKTT